MVSTPLLRLDEPIGILSVRRYEVRPFTDQQIQQLEGFARQAVIAIETMRLIQESSARNSDLTAMLEQQTATNEILRVIGSSPGDLQTVLDAVVDHATG